MKFKYLSIPFLSSTLLFSAYASIQSDLRNLIQETTKQDVDVYKVIKTSEGRKNLITSLKKSYEVNPDKTTKLLLDAWKQSAEKGEIDIEKINFPDVGIYATGNDPLKIELKVEYFDMEYQDLNNFSINVKLNYNFNWHGNYSSNGFAAKKGDKHVFDLPLAIKPSSKNQSKTISFITKTGEGVDTEWIEFPVSLSWSLQGKINKVKEILRKSFWKAMILEQILNTQLISLDTCFS